VSLVAQTFLFVSLVTQTFLFVSLVAQTFLSVSLPREGTLQAPLLKLTVGTLQVTTTITLLPLGLSTPQSRRDGKIARKCDFL
jgi:hypothetical protein